MFYTGVHAQSSSPSACWFWKEENMFFQYFLTRFSEVLTSEHTDEINGEFRLHQSLPAIPEELDTSQIYEEDHFRADILWHELQEVKDVNGKEKLGLR